MPEIILNVSGTTRTTGTANPTITGDTGKSGSFSDIATGTEIAYYRRYSSNKPGFENCTGIWRAVAAAGSIGYIERGSVEKSSNGGSAVVWGVGEQIIDVTITPDMIVADDDPRLETVDISDLNPSTSNDGTELIAASKNGDGVSLTVQQIAGNSLTVARGHARDYVEGYSDFSKTRQGFSATDGVLCDAEPWTCYLGNTGSVLQYAILAPTVFDPTMALTTGTNSAGYACLRHTRFPLLFDPTKEMIDIARFSLSALPAGGQEHTFQSGFIVGAPTLATQGMFLQLSQADAQFQAVVHGAAGAYPVDTGITAVPLSIYTRKIHYDPVALATKFYLDGVLVATITNAERVVATNQMLSMASSLRKSLGVTTHALLLANHYYRVKKSQLAYFA